MNEASLLPLATLLRGTFNGETRAVRLTKMYERPVPEGTEVEYEGKLHALNGKPEITGTWLNRSGGTSGTFSCMMQGGGAGNLGGGGSGDGGGDDA